MTLAVACAAMSGVAGGAHAAQPRVGEASPRLVLHSFANGDIDLGRRSGQVMVVNFWATWCPPCRAEMPMLNAFYLAHQEAGVLVVGVSADRSRDKAEAARVMSAFAYPAGLLAEAQTELDAPRVLPMTYVVDRQGVVRAVFAGLAAPLNASMLEAAVQPLLAPPAKTA